MLKLICWVVVIFGVVIAGLLALRALDLRADAMAQRTLLAMQPENAAGFLGRFGRRPSRCGAALFSPFNCTGHAVVNGGTH